MVMEGDLTWDELTRQYTGDVLSDCTPETGIILLTNVTITNSVKVNTRTRISQEDGTFSTFNEMAVRKIYSLKLF